MPSGHSAPGTSSRREALDIAVEALVRVLETIAATLPVVSDGPMGVARSGEGATNAASIDLDVAN